MATCTSGNREAADDHVWQNRRSALFEELLDLRGALVIRPYTDAEAGWLAGEIADALTLSDTVRMERLRSHARTLLGAKP